MTKRHAFSHQELYYHSLLPYSLQWKITTSIKKGEILHKEEINSYGDNNIENYNKEIYKDSTLRYRDPTFNKVMKAQIDATRASTTIEIDYFKEYVKDRLDIIRILENKVDFLTYLAHKPTIDNYINNALHSNTNSNINSSNRDNSNSFTNSNSTYDTTSDTTSDTNSDKKE